MTQYQDDPNSIPQAEETGQPPEMASEEELAFVAPAQGSANRSAMLLLVGLVLLGGGVLYLMHLRGGPKTVQASAESSKAKSTISEFLSNKNGVEEMRATLKNTEKMVDQFVNQSADNQVPVEDLKTNPFQLRPAAKPENPDDEKARLAAEAAAAEAQRKAQEQAQVKKDASALRIESILLGGKQRICMINNSSYVVGQEINGFKIQAIEKGYVVVSKAGYTLKISMLGK